jgi:CelD/BcsL family acetyltransferase involved in cellulose biosynthesis
VALANGSAVRHGWPPVYDRTTVEQVLGIPGARLLRAEWDGRTIGGFVGLEHDRRIYLWAGGIDHTVLREVSPYLFMLYEVLSTGVERGWERVEFGRGNDTFKRRYGFSGTELWSLWYAARPEDVAVYRSKLATLHEGLAHCMGL